MKIFSNALFYLSDKKVLTIGFLLACTAYTVWYMFLSDPLQSYGALSYIGLKHPILFSVWGFLVESALMLNIGRMFLKFNYRNSYALFLLLLGLVSIIITIWVPFNYNDKIKFFVHCYGAISFTIYHGVSMIFLFVQKRRIKKIFLPTAFIIGIIMLMTLGALIAFGESGILEVSPMLASFLILALVNYTKIFEPVKVTVDFQTADEKEPVYK